MFKCKDQTTNPVLATGPYIKVWIRVHIYTGEIILKSFENFSINK